MLRRLRPPLLLLHSLAAWVSETAAAVIAERGGGTVWATPHDSYSSSVGILGCKVDTNRIAYWPNAVDCSNICVSVYYQDRNVHLLRVDQSQGAWDISYDAWNYLYTGHSATDKPAAGGPVEMQFEYVHASECSDLIRTEDSRLPFSAANSMNFLTSCLDQNDTWVGQNFVLFNILDSICTLGHDEKCDLDYPAANQASCPHTLGIPETLDGSPVYNIRYPSGEKVLASNGQPAPAEDEESGDEDLAVGLACPHTLALVLLVVISTVLSRGF